MVVLVLDGVPSWELTFFLLEALGVACSGDMSALFGEWLLEWLEVEYLLGRYSSRSSPSWSVVVVWWVELPVPVLGGGVSLVLFSAAQRLLLVEVLVLRVLAGCCSFSCCLPLVIQEAIWPVSWFINRTCCFSE